MDVVDTQTRARMMAGIRGKDTRPERVLRSGLHARGFRFRLHPRNVPGKPDIVLPKHRAAVFVHGCFWHRHTSCPYATTPSTRPEFWQAKFDANVARDRSVRVTLLHGGWRVATIWECALRRTDQIDATTESLAAWLRLSAREIEIGKRSALPGTVEILVS